jgi:hypothetical protein
MSIEALRRWPEYAEEMDDLMIELSRDSERADEMMERMASRGTASAKVVRRLVEMLEDGLGGYGVGYCLFRLGRGRLADDAKPIVMDYCLRTLTESLDHSGRHQALETLKRIGDVWVLPELEEIARSVDAEGIEEELARTIETLEKRAKGQR